MDLGGAPRATGRNPVLPLQHHVPDPEARVMPDGRLYVYGSYDLAEREYCSDRYHVASTADLCEWTVHDVAFRAEDAAWAGPSRPMGRSFLDGAESFDDLPEHVRSSLPEGTEQMPFEEFASAVRAAAAERLPKQTLLYAPDAIERDGRYFLYMCLSDGTEGVAVSDSPEGPFADAVQLPVTGIDPSVFIDDDGAAYYYWGQFESSGARLGPDMMTLDQASVVDGLLTEGEHHFHEGSSMRKRGDLYYLVYAEISRGKPTSLGYATSYSPLGPFTYRGVIVDNADCDPESWNNHGSIAEVGGQWYVFYHRASRGVSSMRRLCIEPIEFSPDGSIPEVPMTSQGAGEPFAAGEEIPAFTACGLSGHVRIAPDGHGSEALTEIAPGDTAVFRYVDGARAARVSVQGTGVGSVEVRTSAGSAAVVEVGGGAVEVDLPESFEEIVLVFHEAQKLTVHSLRFD
ncbi:family 43 glycosylhydrolase [Demequina zhanjiangensis]|uniref:Family 43 glycosylhydrolase n=1 Tax=Demequina zhanjiangensis TaxID=3051659 RepID=A0ABT8G1Q2_9MICO|nr:family 43 glycosylhydrolase [Demequina sp. SYSU T00b26]MDN4473057.1 family 43 glycosylhydrolase [Demequina sp. SYSU T00b26]